jgi:peptide/nickel transport system permease protein
MARLVVGVISASLVVVEVISASPGIGLYTAQSIPMSDFPANAGVTLLMGATYVLVNTAVDLLQAAADPACGPTDC